MKFKTRKAETLSEAVVTIAIFGILLLGLTDFMSSQIHFTARTRYRDKIISTAQELVARSGDKIFVELRNFDKNVAYNDTALTDNMDYIQKNIIGFDWEDDKKILTLYDSNAAYSINFAFP